MHGASKTILAESTSPIEALPLKLELATQRKHATSVPLPALRTTINRWACGLGFAAAEPCGGSMLEGMLFVGGVAPVEAGEQPATSSIAAPAR